jgi:Zn-dependent protease/predicted transcriptional regulator
MNGRAWPIARIYGIEIRIHWSWIPVLALVTFATTVELGAIAPDTLVPTRWAAGGLLGFLFLASIIAHELAHSIVAKRRGLAVLPITIVFFGGIASLDQEAPTPADEAAIAAAGPIVSLVLGVILVGIGFAIADAVPAVALGTAAVGGVNVLLGSINLLPGLPLDGGRVLRAVVWKRTGDPRRGTRVAATVGRGVGVIGIGAGLAVSLIGDGTTGVIVLVSGWFLLQGARAMERRVLIEELLNGVHVGEVMEKSAASIAPNLTVDTFAEQLLGDPETTSLPVISGDALIGIIGASQLRKIGRRKWSELRAADVMTARPSLPQLGVGDDLWSALELLRRTGLDGLPVMAGSVLEGILTRRAVAMAIQARASKAGAALR